MRKEVTEYKWNGNNINERVEAEVFMTNLISSMYNQDMNFAEIMLELNKFMSDCLYDFEQQTMNDEA